MWIRTASKRDIPAVRALLVETWHATYDRIYGIERVDEITGEWYSETALARNLARPEAEFLVADDGTKIAGMAFVAWDGVGEFKPDQQHLEKLICTNSMCYRTGSRVALANFCSTRC